MDKQTRKNLVNEYLQTKTEMGIYCFKCIPTDTHYLGYTQNTKAMINGSIFRLGAGNHKDKALQLDWNTYGQDNFNISILEVLPYDKDNDAKEDYTFELELLLESWSDKLINTKII